MPPVQPSLRGLLLTSASAVALSVSASAAQAGPHAPLTIWAESAPFWTGGGSFNVPSLPSLGAPYTSFDQLNGLEGAVGFDYQWLSTPWHFVFDFRYGKTRTASAGSSSFHSSITTPFFVTQTSSTSSQATEHESHLVTDFMIGRDLGIGTGKPELQFGIRIADLHADAHVVGSERRTFYSSGVFPPTVTTTQSATGDWSSRFFGVGPRVAVVGGIPIVGEWSFDYSGGAALLIGDRSFNVSTSTGFTLDESTTTVVFNTDGWLALSYSLGPQFKISTGMRSDFYISALTTYDVNTGALQNISRVYWGPFVRLTGTF